MTSPECPLGAPGGEDVTISGSRKGERRAQERDEATVSVLQAQKGDTVLGRPGAARRGFLGDLLVG